MKFHPSVISPSKTTTSARPCVVDAETCLKDVVSKIDADAVSHILVESNGQLIGVVETGFVLSRLSAQNPVERQRWEQMSVEATLQWKIAPSNPAPQSNSATRRKMPVDCTAVESEDGISALVSDEDVFVSWQVVQQSLSEAMTDSVTALPNRHVFERRLAEEISRSSRDGLSLAVILFDVDKFKEVNDIYGHCVGDVALHSIASQIKSRLRSYDVLARYGGDEFAAVCSGCGPGDIDIPIGRILDGIKSSFARTAIALPPLSLSIGAVVVHNVTQTDHAEDIIELADMCLYRSKDNGRDCAFKMELESFASQSTPPVQVHASSTTSDVADLAEIANTAEVG